MTPGIPTKLNIPKVTSGGSPKAAIAANLSGAKRATGTSYGIFAQRSMLGSGIQYNNFAYNSAGIADTRRSLNANRPRLFNNVSPHQCNHNGQDNTMNKFMMGMMAMQMLGQMTAQTVDTINSMKSTDKTSNKAKEYGTPDNEVKKQPKTLSELKTALDTANTNVANFNNEYANNPKLSTVNNSITDINVALSAAGVAADLNLDLTAISLTELNLTADSSLADIDTAITNIESKDIAAVDNFSNNITGAISSINAKISELSGDYATNQTKIDKLTQARGKLETLRDTQLSELKTDLTTKKDKLSGIRTEKANAMDKVYTQAQADDAKIGANNTEMDKLATEIGKETNQNKKNKLIAKYNNLAADNLKLQTALKALPSETKNSQGETLTLNNVNGAKTENYTAPAAPNQPAQPVNLAQGGNGTGFRGLGIGSNGQIVPQFALATDIDSCRVGQKVQVNGTEYENVGGDQFKSADGTLISAEDLKALQTPVTLELEPESIMFQSQNENWWSTHS